MLAGGPWDEAERAAILRYCESDVLALERLLLAMLPRIDRLRSLLRGRFMKAAAAMEYAGVPIDTATLALLRGHWTGIQDELIARSTATTACSTAAASALTAGRNISPEMGFLGRA